MRERHKKKEVIIILNHRIFFVSSFSISFSFHLNPQIIICVCRFSFSSYCCCCCCCSRISPKRNERKKRRTKKRQRRTETVIKVTTKLPIFSASIRWSVLFWRWSVYSFDKLFRTNCLLCEQNVVQWPSESNAESMWTTRLDQTGIWSWVPNPSVAIDSI